MALVTLLSVSAMAGTAAAQFGGDPVTPDMAEVGVDEHLSETLPLDLEFIDSDSGRVKLGDFFDGKRPVLLTLNYSNCPKLCSQQLNGLVNGIDGIAWDLGDEYRIITVSIDPAEPPERAAQTKEKYLATYGRTGCEDGWHFLTTTDDDTIHRLANAVGFGYRFDPETGVFLHQAVTMVCMPDGRISNYLYGIEYPAQTVRLAMVEAADGQIGTAMDKVLLFCFRYDPDKGRYSMTAYKIMQLGGALTVVCVGGLLSVYWIRERRKARKAPAEEKS